MRICFGEIAPSGAMDSMSACNQVPYHFPSIKLRYSACRGDVAPRLKLMCWIAFLSFPVDH
jgi:hypothetical protein